jgi:hypothetical protein
VHIRRRKREPAHEAERAAKGRTRRERGREREREKTAVGRRRGIANGRKEKKRDARVDDIDMKEREDARGQARCIRPVRGAKAERSHCDSINDAAPVAMRDPVREALYGPLRRRGHSPQRVIPSLRELRRIKVSAASPGASRDPAHGTAGFSDKIFIRRTAA